MTQLLVDATAWQTVFFGLCSFPAFLTSGLLRLGGQGRTAHAVARWIYWRWLAAEPAERFFSSSWRTWAAVAVTLPVFAIIAYLLSGIVINLAYPLRPDVLPTDWGGPSLAGRWTVHAVGGLVFAMITPLISIGLRNVSRRVLVGPEQATRTPRRT